MKQIVLLGMMVVVGLLGWRIGGQLSSDAVSMAVGVLFGVLAGVPAALMVMASSRRRETEREDHSDGRYRGGASQPQNPYGGYMPQPPVIVVTGTPNTANPQHVQQQHALPAPHDISIDAREFKVVGETEEWIDEW